MAQGDNSMDYQSYYDLSSGSHHSVQKLLAIYQLDVDIFQHNSLSLESWFFSYNINDTYHIQGRGLEKART